MKKTYDVQQRGEEYILTLSIDRDCLFLCWKSDMPGSCWEFQGIEVDAFNLSMLKQARLMSKLADLPEQIAPGACLQLVRQWGFVRVAS